MTPGEIIIASLLFLIFVTVADYKALKWVAIGFLVVAGGYLLFFVAVLAFFAWPWSQFF